MELKIDSDRVIAAAEKCSTAKEILQTLFPEAFKKEKPEIDLLRLNESYQLFAPTKLVNAGLDSDTIEVRQSGEYKNRAFWLSSQNFSWELKQDGLGALCLIPTRKD